MSIFVTGNSRSGTTMMGRILGNHPDVFTFQELHFFDEVLTAGINEENVKPETAYKLFALMCCIQRNGYFGNRNFAPFIQEAKSIIDSGKINSYSDIFNKFLLNESQLNHKIIPCDQTPQNIFYLEEIFRHQPNSKVIVMVRDPREVLLSQKNKWKRRKLSGGKIPFREAVRSRINYHPVTISRIWKSVMKTAGQYQDHPAVHFVKYEDLISNPEETVQTVCKHIGINFSSEMLNIPVVGSSNFTDSESSLGIDTSKTGQWQNGGLNEAEIHICQSVNADQMLRFGYKKVSVSPNIFSTAWYKFSLPFSLSLAVLFNLKRLKNPGKIIKRFWKK